EQVELLRRQLEISPVERRAAGALVHGEAADLQHAGRKTPGAATRDGADAGDQLAQAEGLHDVVVGAELEADDAVALLAARGDDDDRHVRPRAQLAADVEAVT